ncbi:hypothetical protein AJ78_07879 [Emergomyces pasteurianus Ep9510]|uniref:Uncharacterized protein n=1 Tax=Emergomyces pasteurianus Ep9510 TaxID=1447872 RepID=A0A1J9Q4Z9_9EURO|nr:hypothetical protein AJ78_07879 [Emergomyces pasteurianus Ep9510]
MNTPITISNPPYTYTNNTLFISVSGNNQHRRAAIPELNELFSHAPSSNAAKDPPAHWYEAQLRFYGLDVSKTKSVAKMRLFDAVRSGGLVVPGHIKDIEAKMEKEWKAEVRKQSQEQKKRKKAEIESVNDAGGPGGPSGPGSAGSKAKGKGKRKADDIDATASGDTGRNANDSVSANVGAAKVKEKEKEKNIKAPASKRVKLDSDAKPDPAMKKNTALKMKTKPQNTARNAAPKAKAEKKKTNTVTQNQGSECTAKKSIIARTKPEAKMLTKKNTAAATDATDAGAETNPTSSSTSTSRRGGGTTKRGKGGLANVASSGGRTTSTPTERVIPMQTARRSRPFPYPGRIVGPPPASESATNDGPGALDAGCSEPSPPRMPFPRQTARRSRPFPYPGRNIGPNPSPPFNSSYSDSPLHSSPSRDNHYDSYGTNYRDSINNYSEDGYDDDDHDNNWDSGTPSPSPGPLTSTGPLGLLNGRYSLESSDLREWSMYDDHPFTLILTLHQNALWGAYDFGMFSGVLYIPQRPWESSADKKYEFSWRGRENSEGQVSFDDSRQKGWIRFLGNGRIDGMIGVYGKARFSGVRVSGEQTRSERDAASLREEWDRYSQEVYEYERVARWR